MPPLALVLHADLDFSVDLGDGPVAGRVEADGGTVRVTTGDAAAVWTSVTEAMALTAPAPLAGDGVPALASLLAGGGVQVEVVGAAGTVATVGAGVDSVVGRLTAGTRAVRPGSARAVAPLVRVRLRSTVRRRRAAVLIAGGTAAVAVLVVILRARRP